MRFLTGTTNYLLRKLLDRGHIKPQRHGRNYYYRFADVVAVRTFVHLKNSSPSRIPVDVNIVPSLAKFAGDDQAVHIGVTSTGNVFKDHGDGMGWIDIVTGQAPLQEDMMNLDNVFRPFRLGGGRVPGLLNISNKPACFLRYSMEDRTYTATVLRLQRLLILMKKGGQPAYAIPTRN